MLKQRTPAEEVLQEVRSISGTPVGPIPYRFRNIAIYAVLQLGARSFSHFLNATERYTALLKALATSSEEKRDLLICVKEYWINNTQTRVVTMDKYLQYGLIETDDVINLIFGYLSGLDSELPEEEKTTVWTDFHGWELLRMVLDKSMGRVTQIKRKVEELEKEDEVAQARWKAQKEMEAELGDGGREETATVLMAGESKITFALFR